MNRIKIEDLGKKRIKKQEKITKILKNRQKIQSVIKNITISDKIVVRDLSDITQQYSKSNTEGEVAV